VASFPGLQALTFGDHMSGGNDWWEGEEVPKTKLFRDFPKDTFPL